MRIVLVLLSLAIHQVVGTPVITLLDDDVSNHPLCQAPDLLDCRKAQVNVHAILNDDPVSFPRDLTMSKTRSFQDEDGSQIFELKSIKRNSSQAMITVTTDDVVTVNVETVTGLDYNLVNCGPDFYLWRTINETFYNHLDFYPTGQNLTKRADRKLDSVWTKLVEESRSSDKVYVISIKVYYTPTLQRSGTNVRALLANLVTEANVAFENSKIPIWIRAKCPEVMNVYESDTAETRLTDAASYFLSLESLYDDCDLAILLTSTCSYDACGAAATINVIDPSFQVFNRPIRFAWAATNTGPRFTFVHELGHLLGGEHDRTQLGCGAACPRTAHGYLVQDFPLHTLMAGPTRFKPLGIPFFSSPSVTHYTGAVLGTPVDDVRTTIMAVRAAVSALGNDRCRRGCWDAVDGLTCKTWRDQFLCDTNFVRSNCRFSCGFC